MRANPYCFVRFRGLNYRGLSGRISFGSPFPGRCPGLRNYGPLGLVCQFTICPDPARYPGRAPTARRFPNFSFVIFVSTCGNFAAASRNMNPLVETIVAPARVKWPRFLLIGLAAAVILAGTNFRPRPAFRSLQPLAAADPAAGP